MKIWLLLFVLGALSYFISSFGRYGNGSKNPQIEALGCLGLIVCIVVTFLLTGWKGGIEVLIVLFFWAYIVENFCFHLRPIGKHTPWISTLSLLYPMSSSFYVVLFTPANILIVIGHGLAQLGYLLFIAGILTGKFMVFRLGNRRQVLTAAVILFLLGAVLVNI